MLSSCLKGGWLHFEDVSAGKSCRGQKPGEKQIREVAFSSQDGKVIYHFVYT